MSPWVLEFTRFTEDAPAFAYENYVHRMADTLDFLISEQFPSADFGISELRDLCLSLVQGQRNDTQHLKHGSWSIVRDTPLPSDARVQFAFFPTYIALAILTYTARNHASIAQSIPGFNKALRMGCVFASYRNLAGHGYEAMQDTVEAVEILTKGEVFRYITETPEPVPQFLDAVTHARQKLQDRLNKQTESDENHWSYVPHEALERALAQLEGVPQ